MDRGTTNMLKHDESENKTSNTMMRVRVTTNMLQTGESDIKQA